MVANLLYTAAIYLTVLTDSALSEAGKNVVPLHMIT